MQIKAKLQSLRQKYMLLLGFDSHAPVRKLKKKLRIVEDLLDKLNSGAVWSNDKEIETTVETLNTEEDVMPF